MDRRRTGKILMISGIGLIFLIMLVIIIFQAAKITVPPTARVSLLICFLIVALTMIGVGEWLFMERGRVYSNRRKYKKLPYRKIIDFKAELEKLRENFAADGYSGKNRIPKPPFKANSDYFDFSVLKNGKIYYACLVEANEKLFTKMANNSDMILPAVFIYSTDEYYEAHPHALKHVANYLFNNRKNNILKNERDYFYNYPVDQTLTEGRVAYLTTVMVYRPHLPLGYLNCEILPLIADPQNCSSAFVLEEKYWTEDLGCYLINGDDRRKIMQSEIDAYDNYPLIEITDYAAELSAVSGKYFDYLDETDGEDYYEEDEGQPEEASKESANDRIIFYYSYVLHVDKAQNEPFYFEDVFSAVVLYGEDGEYRDNPLELAKIADAINCLSVDERKALFAQAADVKTGSVKDIPVPTELTGGKEAFISTVQISRRELPKRSVTGNLLPVMKFEGKTGSLYAVGKSFWTEGITSQFVRGQVFLGQDI